MLEDVYKTPFLLFVSAFAMTLTTSVIVTSSCNHTVTADIVEVRALDEYGECRLTVLYNDVESSQIKECSDVPTSSTVDVCYRHWDRSDFFTYEDERVPYFPLFGVLAMIVASWALCVATCVAFLHASRHKGPRVPDKRR